MTLYKSSSWIGWVVLGVQGELEHGASLAPPENGVAPGGSTLTVHSLSDAGRWFAVQSLPRRETYAAGHLRNQDFKVFLPCRRTTRRHARKLETIAAPFFPGYLFAFLDLKRDRWRSVNGTYGVASLVMQGELPAPVPRGIVEALLEASDTAGLLQWDAGLRVGQTVRILEGPFTEFIGQLDRLDDARRVRVLLDIMGGRVPVILPRECVEPVSRSLNS